MPSRSGKKVLIDSIGQLVPRWQEATQKFDETVGEIYDLNPAERHCLSFLWPHPQTASAIAREVRLTPAAVTALIDRLERRGFVAREADPNDRRKVLVRATDKTTQLSEEAYGPIARAGEKLLAAYSDAELATILKFTQQATALQQRMTDELLARHGKRKS